MDATAQPAAPVKGEMSAEAFESLMNRLDAQSIRRKYSDKSRCAARLVMVDGATEQQAAVSADLTYQGVSQLIKRIRRRMESLPEGWVQITGFFPPVVAKQLEALSVLLQAVQKSGLQPEVDHYNIVLTDVRDEQKDGGHEPKS
ncbi:TrfB-related DNA-binding protein [Pseudomonas reactans]|uniref:TrfB-related DNA-binding protein n=1 Tax=Pseudomonas reactans TaxID=117680 RepID=UPI0015A24ECA|nr:TrfB-related DNA-binding protein [Pseudomonas reactans]NWC89990.1 hypothetical protein [Pseudomonas reactans]